MAKRKKPFPLSLIIIIVLLLIIYFMSDGNWGTGTNTGEAESSQEDTSAFNQTPPATTNRVVGDSIDVIEDTAQQVTADIKDTMQLSEVADTTNLLKVNTILITKRNDSLYYKINEKIYTNLLQGIAETDYTLSFNIKLAGNLTYADEREIKDLLEAKDINFNIEE